MKHRPSQGALRANAQIRRAPKYEVATCTLPSKVRTNLRQQAAAAARFTDLDARVTKIAADGRERSERSVPRWDQTRVWDPGD